MKTDVDVFFSILQVGINKCALIIQSILTVNLKLNATTNDILKILKNLFRIISPFFTNIKLYFKFVIFIFLN